MKKSIVLFALLLVSTVSLSAREKQQKITDKIYVIGEFKGKELFGHAKFVFYDVNHMDSPAILDGNFTGMQFTAGTLNAYGITIDAMGGKVNIVENGSLVEVEIHEGLLKQKNDREEYNKCGTIQSSRLLFYTEEQRRIKESDADSLLRNVINENKLSQDQISSLWGSAFFFLSGKVTPEISIPEERAEYYSKYTKSAEYKIIDNNDKHFFYIGDYSRDSKNLCNMFLYENSYVLYYPTGCKVIKNGAKVSLINSYGENLSYDENTNKLLPGTISRKNYNMILDRYIVNDEQYRHYEDYMMISKVIYRYDNGVVFEGPIKGGISDRVINMDGKCLASSPDVFFDDIQWDYKDLTKNAVTGKLSYPNGQYYEGTFNVQYSPMANTPEASLFLTGKLYDASGSMIHEYIDGADELELVRRQELFAESSKQDYFKFNNYGDVSNFRKSFKNGAVVTYSQDSLFTITFIDGIVCDLSSSFDKSDFKKNGERAYYVKVTRRSTSDDLPINDVYRDYFSDDNVLYDPYTMPFSSYSVTFPDGNVALMRVNSKYGKYEGDRYHQDNYICGFTQVMPNNERIEVVDKGFGFECVSLTKSFSDCRVTMPNWLNVSITYSNGDIYTGYAKAISGGNNTISNLILDNVLRKYCRKYPDVYFENIIGMKYDDGKVVNSNGQLIDIYEDGKKLSDFDKAQVIAKEQGALNLAKQEAENQKKQETELVRKYGQKYVDALFRGKIIVGMPQDLFALGLKTNSFIGVFSASVSIVRENSTCLDLYNISPDFKAVYVGYLWIDDGKISSISLY